MTGIPETFTKRRRYTLGKFWRYRCLCGHCCSTISLASSLFLFAVERSLAVVVELPWVITGVLGYVILLVVFPVTISY
jgi:hypothetical protein